VQAEPHSGYTPSAAIPLAAPRISWMRPLAYYTQNKMTLFLFIKHFSCAQLL